MTRTESCDSAPELRLSSSMLDNDRGPDIAAVWGLRNYSARESWKRLAISPGVTSSGWLLTDCFPEDSVPFRIDPAGWLEANGRLVKENGIGRVFSIAASLKEKSPLCFVKERRYRRAYELLVQRLGQSGLRRASRLAEYLHHATVPTPLSWGFITLKGRSETREYKVAQSVPGGRSLYDFLREEYLTLDAAESRLFRSLMTESLAELVARLHQAGCENRDLKATNLVMASPLETLREQERVELYLIDLEGVRRLGYVPRFRRERDITRLNLSLLIRARCTHADRARFLTRYQSYMGKSDWREAWHRVARSTDRRLSTAARTGKPIH